MSIYLLNLAERSKHHSVFTIAQKDYKVIKVSHIIITNTYIWLCLLQYFIVWDICSCGHTELFYLYEFPGYPDKMLKFY